MSGIKQLTVISGKGGTGKTSIVGAFAALAENKVLADCDVDAADLHLLLSPKVVEEQDFKALRKAVIDLQKCIKCGRCIKNCRFNAINEFKVDTTSCEGCAVCTIVCPSDAVSMNDYTAGKAYISKTRFGQLCHARLNPGEEASGKLVSLVRKNAKKIAEKQKKDLIIIDGSPGIGCPVIASIGGADLALIITEPTVSGIHDLKRILAVAEHFKVKPAVCINKHDINQQKTREIEKYCTKNKIKMVGKIPYNQDFIKAMTEGKTIIEHSKGGIIKTMRELWGKTESILKPQGD